MVQPLWCKKFSMRAARSESFERGFRLTRVLAALSVRVLYLPFNRTDTCSGASDCPWPGYCSSAEIGVTNPCLLG